MIPSFSDFNILPPQTLNFPFLSPTYPERIQPFICFHKSCPPPMTAHFYRFIRYHSRLVSLYLSAHTQSVSSGGAHSNIAFCLCSSRRSSGFSTLSFYFPYLSPAFCLQLRRLGLSLPFYVTWKVYQSQIYTRGSCSLNDSVPLIIIIIIPSWHSGFCPGPLKPIMTNLKHLKLAPLLSLLVEISGFYPKLSLLLHSLNVPRALEIFSTVLSLLKITLNL